LAVRSFIGYDSSGSSIHEELVMSTVAANLTAVTSIDAATMDRTAEATRCILFFDGVCGLCNKAVDFVLARDLEGHFQFAPLQGETARQLLSPADAGDLNSMVLLIYGRTYRKSSAAVRILWQLSLGWRILGTVVWLVPLPIRNLAYRLIAANRYRLFGRRETCRMPTPAERSRFLP
jgi:predicted DCC family thiol-disulfide oxidoreductase YuxK